MDYNEFRQKEFARRDERLQNSRPMRLKRTGKLKDKLHIVYVMTWFGICGGSKIIFEHCNRLVQRGHQVSIVCHFQKPDWFPLDDRINFVQPPYEEALHIPPCDIIVVTYWKEIYECMEQNVAPVVYFEQGDTHLFDPGALDTYTMSHIQKQIQIAPFVYTVSGYAAEKLSEQFGVKADVIPNAINKAVFYPGSGEKNDKTVITTIGPDYIGFKRIHNILASIRQLREKGHDIEFIWITPGPPGEGVTEAAIVNPEQQVIGECLRRTDIYICASMYESFCLPVLEAMTCGAAIVTTDCGGIRDYVTDGENALLIEKDDVSDMTAKLALLMNDAELRKRLRDSGLETAKKYDWELTVDRLEEYYRRIAGYYIPPESVGGDRTLIHTLLLLIREESGDLEMTKKCLRSLEKSRYKTVVIFNQGTLTNEELEEFLEPFRLDCVVIGNGTNAGTIVGRQSCFDIVYRWFPDTVFISEIHPDMIFSTNWEDALVSYLAANEDEPMIGCGIVTDASVPLLGPDDTDAFLAQYQRDQVERGFNLPCVHKAEVLKAVGGYDARFLTGKQAFEDDSLLLGYHYYYGTRANWAPKVNCNSVVYHAVGGQRFGLNDNLFTNYDGLIKQYGAMGIGALAKLHVSPWQKQFFEERFAKLTE